MLIEKTDVSPKKIDVSRERKQYKLRFNKEFHCRPLEEPPFFKPVRTISKTHKDYSDQSVRFSTFQKFVISRTGKKDWSEITREDILNITQPELMKKGAISGLYQHYYRNKSLYQRLGSEKAPVYYLMLADFGLTGKFGITEKDVLHYHGRVGWKAAVNDVAAEELRPKVEIPDGWLGMREALRKHGISKKMLEKFVMEGAVGTRILENGSRQIKLYDDKQIKETVLLRQKGWIDAAVRIGMGKTCRKFRKRFRDEFLPQLLKMLEKGFGTGAARALEAVMEMKRLETGRRYLKPWNEDWEKITKEVENSILQMEKALERDVEFKLTNVWEFARSENKTYGPFALEKKLKDMDGRPAIVRVWGERPWARSFYREDELVLRSALQFDESTALKLQAIESYLDSQALNLSEFVKSMEYKLGKTVGQETGLAVASRGAHVTSSKLRFG